MDLSSLPDEMCASVMKYFPSDEINKLRKISIRMDKIVKAYELDRYEVRHVNINVGLLCEPHSYMLEEKAAFEERLKTPKDAAWKKWLETVIRLYTFEIPKDGIDYKICTVDVILKNKNESFEKESKETENSLWRHIYKTFADERDTYTVLNNILSKLKCTETLSIQHGKFRNKLAECLRQNKNLFRKCKSVIIRSVSFDETETDLNFLKLFKGLECISFQSMKSDCGIILEKVLSDFDAGITFKQTHITSRKPHNFGDKKLLQWIGRIPSACWLEGYQNNFSQPLFRTFLLKLISSPFTKQSYHFGSFSSKTGSLEEMIRFLLKHGLSHKKIETDGGFKFEIDIPAQDVKIEFEIEKAKHELKKEID